MGGNRYLVLTALGRFLVGRSIHTGQPRSCCGLRRDCRNQAGYKTLGGNTRSRQRESQPCLYGGLMGVGLMRMQLLEEIVGSMAGKRGEP